MSDDARARAPDDRQGTGMIYVLTMWNTAEARHELILNGPFGDHESAATWGADWGDTNGDCPMWQVVHLATTDVPVRAIPGE